MSITPKDDFIRLVLSLMCKRCSRRKRIEQRLKRELRGDDFDYEKDKIASKIIAEEA